MDNINGVSKEGISANAALLAMHPSIISSDTELANTIAQSGLFKEPAVVYCKIDALDTKSMEAIGKEAKIIAYDVGGSSFKSLSLTYSDGNSLRELTDEKTSRDDVGVALYTAQDNRGKDKSLIEKVKGLFPRAREVIPNGKYGAQIKENLDKILDSSILERDFFDIYKAIEGNITYPRRTEQAQSINQGFISNHISEIFSKSDILTTYDVWLTWAKSGKLDNIPVKLAAIYVAVPGAMGSSGIRGVTVLEQEQTAFVECRKKHLCEKTGMLFYYLYSPEHLNMVISKIKKKKVYSIAFGNELIIPYCEREHTVVQVTQNNLHSRANLDSSFQTFEKKLGLNKRQLEIMENLGNKSYIACQMVKLPATTQ
jgi:hypothetical protein